MALLFPAVLVFILFYLNLDRGRGIYLHTRLVHTRRKVGTHYTFPPIYRWDMFSDPIYLLINLLMITFRPNSVAFLICCVAKSDILLFRGSFSSPCLYRSCCQPKAAQLKCLATYHYHLLRYVSLTDKIR